MKLGKKLRMLRKEHRLTLKELSTKSGVAIATLSRMENDIMTGTLDSHKAICTAMGISMGEFIHEVETDGKIVTLVKGALGAEVHGKSASTELLTTMVMNKKMMPLLLRIAPGSKTNVEQNKIGIEKFIYLVSGNLRTEIGKDKHALTKGDCLYFDGSLPHQFINEGKQEAVAVYVISPPVG